MSEEKQPTQIEDADLHAATGGATTSSVRLGDLVSSIPEPEAEPSGWAASGVDSTPVEGTKHQTTTYFTDRVAPATDLFGSTASTTKPSS